MVKLRKFDRFFRWGPLVMAAIAPGQRATGDTNHNPIVFDGSIGSPAGEPMGNRILADRGIAVDQNLFHSFSRFNVGEGVTVTFEVPTQTRNILARVTGGEHSTIEGTLATEGPANLYLINPAGILFGNGASINVAGVFTATTADYISLGEGSTELGRYWATTDGTTTLVSAPPTSFGFLTPTPSSLPSGAFDGVVKISGQDIFPDPEEVGSQALSGFRVAANEIVLSNARSDYYDTAVQFVALDFGEAKLGNRRFELLENSQGGAILIENSRLRSFDGGSLSLVTPGSITISNSGIIAETPEGDGTGDAPTRSPGESWLEAWDAGMLFHAGGDISLSGGSDLRASNLASGLAVSTVMVAGGDLLLTENSDVSLVAGGDHSVSAIVLSAGGDLKLKGNSEVNQALRGDHAAGSVVISAGGDLVFLPNDASPGSPSQAAVSQALEGMGSSGGMQIMSGSDTILTGFAEISQSNESTGAPAAMPGQECVHFPAGIGSGIQLNVGGDLRISEFARIITQASGSEPGGDIAVFANSLVISGPERAVTNQERGRSTGLETVTQSGARGGDIRVSVDGPIRIYQAGGIYASTNGSGPSGSICVKGQELEIVGARNYDPNRWGLDTPKNFFITGISNKSAPSAGGDAGSIAVNVDGGIHLIRGGLIDATTFSDSDSGDVFVTAKSILAERDGSDYFTGIGAGTESSGILGPTNGGRGANVTVKANTIRLFSGAQIAASSRASGDAGSVQVVAESLHASGRGTETPFLFTGESGVAAATLGSGSGQGGSVFISAQDLRVSDGASISSTNRSTATAGANAGSVILEPGNLVVDHGRIEVSSKGGNAGDIRIEGGILLDFRHAEVLAEAAGVGGNIFVAGARHVLLDHSRVSANAEVGNGGNIRIGSEVYLVNQSQMTATGGPAAADGQVSIDSQAVLSGAEGELEASPLDVTDSLQPECTDRLATQAGSFIRAGRGGTARMPGGYIPSMRLFRDQAE